MSTQSTILMSMLLRNVRVKVVWGAIKQCYDLGDTICMETMITRASFQNFGIGKSLFGSCQYDATEGTKNDCGRNFGPSGVRALPLGAGINEGGHYCHNPTNNPKQLKTTFVGVVLLSVKNPPPPPPPPRVSLQ